MPGQRLEQFKNYTVTYRHKHPGPEAHFLFHGFPAENVDSDKNRDIAKLLHQQHGHDVYIHHYKGLGLSQGKFSFLDTIKDSVDFVHKIMEKHAYQKVNFLGHSWGGLVTTNVLATLPEDRIGKVLFFSPYTAPTTEEEIVKNVPEMFTQRPHIFNDHTHEEVVRELQQILHEHSPRELVKNLNLKDKDILVLQAKGDETVLANDTKDFVKLIGENVRYLELEIDHSFSDRKLATNWALDFFN